MNERRRFLIAHRGNFFGAKKERENTISYLTEALEKDFHIETDVWFINDQFYLGHDSPTELTDKHFLTQPKVWCHAKQLNALYELLAIGAHCFYHTVDSFTLTSRGYIWTYPGEPLTSRSICVLPKETTIPNVAGICSDDLSRFI